MWRVSGAWNRRDPLFEVAGKIHHHQWMQSLHSWPRMLPEARIVVVIVVVEFETEGPLQSEVNFAAWAKRRICEEWLENQSLFVHEYPTSPPGRLRHLAPSFYHHHRFPQWRYQRVLQELPIVAEKKHALKRLLRRRHILPRRACYFLAVTGKPDLHDYCGSP